MRVVAALGGNALLRRGEPVDPATQRDNVRRAARALAGIARAHALVVTHGNGPQIGLLARASPGASLDVLGAETEGMIGYWIERELRAQLPGREVATLLTQVEVDGDDPAFAHPAKPIGTGDDRRRVASPEPRRILALAAIRLLVEAGVLVVCAGGGGIPVVAPADGAARGVDAVIDKDLSSALLAEQLGADALLLLTDAPAVFRDWPRPARDAIGRATPRELRALSFEAGSMAPKVEAACRFVERTGGRAVIGALEDAERMLDGEAGTQVEAARA